MTAVPSLSSSSSFAARNLQIDPHRPSSSPPSIVSVRSPRPSTVTAAFAAEKESDTYSYAGRTSTIPSPTAASLYEVLGVASAASGPEIKLAYRRLARECHPDVVSVDRRDVSADQFMRIHAAYVTLSDPEKRADYDRTLLRSPIRKVMYKSASFSSSSSAFTVRKNWETDQCW